MKRDATRLLRSCGQAFYRVHLARYGPYRTQAYVVLVDGVDVEEHVSHVDALGSARDLKQAAPERVVAVVDVAAGETVIIES
jgi:hypothetical protein